MRSRSKRSGVAIPESIAYETTEREFTADNGAVLRRRPAERRLSLLLALELMEGAHLLP